MTLRKPARTSLVVLFISVAVRSATACALLLAGNKPAEDPGYPNHVRVVTDRIAPYVRLYAAENAIDIKSLEATLFPKGLPKPTDPDDVMPRYIDSYHPKTDGVCFKSNAVLIYEILRFRNTCTKQRLLAVLFNTQSPCAQFEIESGWKLAIFSERMKLISVFNLDDLIVSKPWNAAEMILTGIEIRKDKLLLVLTNQNTGNGDGPDKGFAFWFKADRSGVALSRVESVAIGDARNYDKIQ